LSILYLDDQIVFPIYKLAPPEGEYSIGSIEITQESVVGRGTLLGIWKGGEGYPDILFGQEIYTAWLDVRPVDYFLLPGETIVDSVCFVGDQVPPGEYESQFWMTANGKGDNMNIFAHLDGFSSASTVSNLLPDVCCIDPVYPNPFNGQTSIAFTVPFGKSYNLKILDQQGRTVTEISNGIGTGVRTIETVNANTFPSGVFYVRLSAAGITATESMVILR